MKKKKEKKEGKPKNGPNATDMDQLVDGVVVVLGVKSKLCIKRSENRGEEDWKGEGKAPVS